MCACYYRPSHVLILSLALALFALGPVSAQPFHLPPAYVTSLHENDTLLILSRGADSVAVAESTIVFVSQGTLVISEPNEEPYYLDLGNLTLGQVSELLRGKFGDRLSIDAPNPLLLAHHLNSSKPDTSSFLVGSRPDSLKANPGNPTVGLGFGAQFVLNDPAGNADGLLGGTGFNLDIVGTHRLHTGPDRLKNLRGRFAPYLFFQGRLGLNANQQLAVNDTTNSTTEGSRGQLEGAVSQADQIVLSGQIDLVWPIFEETEFSLSFSGGVSWTKLDEFTFPLIRVPVAETMRDTLVTATDLFHSILFDDVSNQLREVRPLGDYGVTGLFRFNAVDDVAFYAGAGLGLKGVFKRGIDFDRDENDQPDPNSLRAVLSTESPLFWRLVFGARIEGIAEVRADAVGYLAGERFRSLLRLVVSRTFPITSN